MVKRVINYAKKCKWILLILAIALIVLGTQYPPLASLGMALLMGLFTL